MQHYEESIFVKATPEDIFNFADNHMNFVSHMNKPSAMMGGGSMETILDEGKGMVIGSHIKMTGTAFGFKLYLDEVITKREPPYIKEWQTEGDLRILVIGDYLLGFKISNENLGSRFQVYINYEAPKSFGSKILYLFLGKMYAKWCVRQMIDGVKAHFAK